MINVSETLPLRTVKVRAIKRFSCIFRASCIDAKALKCARFPLLLIQRDKNRREYQQLSIFARLISISTGFLKNDLRRRKQERLGPRKERSACQRTFLLLMLIVVILFGVHFESDWNAWSRYIFAF